LLSKRSEGCKVLLIVDEAQNLGSDTLEEIRLLSNLETSTSKLIQILLLGQPELERKLDSEELRQLRQRISVRWSLAPLSRRETADYVRHRLSVAAGAEREIFSAGALDEIRRCSRGIPRLVNILCDRSLLAGYADGQHRIEAKLVRRAAREVADAGARRDRKTRRPVWKRRMQIAAVAAAVLLALLASERAGLLSKAAVWSHETVGASRFMTMLTGSGPASEERTSRVESGELDGRAGPVVDSSEDVVSGLVTAPVSSAPPHPPSLMSEAVFDWPDLPLAGEAVVSDNERRLNTLPGSFLGRLLDGEGAASVRLQAVNTILDSYQLDPIALAPESDEEALAILSDRGLGVLVLPTADLDELRSLDHPALLALRTETDDWRLVALHGLDERLGHLAGVMGEELLSVPVSELELQWEGEAWVIWDAPEGVPDVLTQGDAGSGVVWLQNALADLGYYCGVASGVFDGSTRAGVVALQLDRKLNPDGVVGPRTQMILYTLLESDEVPRLSSAGEDTLGTLLGAGEDFPAGYDDEAANEEVRFPREDGPG